MTQQEIEARSNGQHGHKDVLNLIKLEGSNQLPQEFITIGKTFEDALGRCTIADAKQRSAIITYKSQLEMFKMTKRIDDLTNFLNASSAIGGINKSLATMSYVGAFVPEGAGIKLSKQGSKEYIESQKRMDEQQRKENNNNNK
jgi:hypothetical protein